MNLKSKVMAMPGSHEKIYSILEGFTTGKLLDTPCGSGALSMVFSDMGHDVYCCDIDSGNFHNHDSLKLDIADHNTDLLPYDDDYFDYIVCSNGLHRLYYPKNLLSEFARVLKPGGIAVLSWTNTNSVARRLKFLLSGTVGQSIENASYDQTISTPGANVRLSLSPERVRLLLDNKGLSLINAYSVGYKIYDYLLAPIGLIIWGCSRLALPKTINNKITLLLGGSTVIQVWKKDGENTAKAE